MKKQLALRMDVLRECGADDVQVEELLHYNQPHFERAGASQLCFPLQDEPFVTCWEEYVEEVAKAGSIRPLEKYLVQLRFPVRAGVSVDPDYLAATRQGIEPPQQAFIGLGLRDPENCKVFLHHTPAGRIPMLLARVREDFVQLVQALTKHNEPAPVLDSMGACMVSGYRNWDRVRRMCGGMSGLADGSQSALSAMFKDKSNYQDRFIILSGNYYSGVPPADIGLSEEMWRDLSVVIRREHECVHYFTRRVFSSMRNNLIDEVIADYWGIVAAQGKFRSDWMLRFFGLEEFPRYRTGGRLENYRGTPPLSSQAFRVLQTLVKRAAENLAVFDQRVTATGAQARSFVRCIVVLSAFTLEELAADSAPDRLYRDFVSDWASLTETRRPGIAHERAK